MFLIGESVKNKQTNKRNPFICEIPCAGFPLRLFRCTSRDIATRSGQFKVVQTTNISQVKYVSENRMRPRIFRADKCRNQKLIFRVTEFAVSQALQEMNTHHISMLSKWYFVDYKSKLKDFLGAAHQTRT